MVDAGILEEVLGSIHNWFVRDSMAVSGCEISDGALPASVTSDLMATQWYRITGSVLNDGLHQHPAEDLADETFDGTIDTLVIPRPLLKVVEDIGEWVEANKKGSVKAQESPYQSESFDGYTYTIKSGSTSNSASGGLTGWQAEFGSRLNQWRKMH